MDEPPPGMLDPEKVSDKDIETIKVNYKGIIKQFGVSFSNSLNRE